MNKRLENKIILVTGATSGIGYNTALALAAENATVIASGRNQQAGEELIQQIQTTGGKAIFIAADVTDKKQIDELFHQIKQNYGRLDAAVNNAGCGGGSGTALHEIEDELWDRIFNTNTKALWHCMQHEIKFMLEQQQGSIINMSSVLGLMGAPWPGGALYTASKHAVIGLTKSAAREYGQANIRVNAVCPGFIETPMLMKGSNIKTITRLKKLVPQGRIATTDEIAPAIIYLCSDESSYMTGEAMVIDGGVMA